MARINIEDQFWMDIVPVAIEMGEQDRAIGQVVRFFRLAQDKHKHGQLISEDDFSRGGFDEALIDRFAIRSGEGIQAVGAEKHFGWLKKKADAGRAGAKKTNEKRWGVGTSQQPSALVGTSQHSSPSPSPSSSLSEKKKNTYAFFDQFERLAKKYRALFKGTTTGPALPRFRSQVTNLTTIAEMDLAMGHYRKFLDANDWRQPKQTFATFLGTEHSSYFWREFITMPELNATGSGLSVEQISELMDEAAV